MHQESQRCRSARRVSHEPPAVRVVLHDPGMTTQNFIACDRDQELLLPPSLKDWLPDDHLAWFVLESVDELDLSDFYASYRADGWGGAAHDPKMMVALYIYAYSIGVRSARAIERRCQEDVAFRVICAGQTPDHATIARFREAPRARDRRALRRRARALRALRPRQRRRRRRRRHQDRRRRDPPRKPHLPADRRGDPERSGRDRRRRRRALRRGQRRRAARGLSHLDRAPRSGFARQSRRSRKSARQRRSRSPAIAKSALASAKNASKRTWS